MSVGRERWVREPSHRCWREVCGRGLLIESPAARARLVGTTKHVTGLPNQLQLWRLGGSRQPCIGDLPRGTRRSEGAALHLRRTPLRGDDLATGATATLDSVSSPFAYLPLPKQTRVVFASLVRPVGQNLTDLQETQIWYGRRRSRGRSCALDWRRQGDRHRCRS